MKSVQNLSLLALGVAAVLTIAACNKSPENAPPPATTAPPPAAATVSAPPPAATPAQQGVSVTSVDLGTAVGADQKVTSPTTSFSPKDTIYAAVSTTGAASNATLAAKWTYQDGQTVNDSSQTIAPTGPAVTTFHISKPHGWPAGNYKVEISLDGNMVSSKDFSVK